MKRRNWIGTTFRILAAWQAVQTFTAIPGFFANVYTLRSGDFGAPAGISVYPGAVSILASLSTAAIVWSASDWLAGKVATTRSGQVSLAGLTSDNLQVAALRVLGAYIILEGIPNLAELAAGYYTLPNGFGLETSYSGRLWARAGGVGFQVAFGVLLLISADRLSRISWSTIRHTRASELDA